MVVSDAVIERMRNVPIFEDIKHDEERLKRFCSIMKKESLSKGTVIIKEGDTGDKLYILFSGSVRIDKKTLANESYTVTLLNSTQNIIFGEIALIDSDKRSATVVAETDCVVYSIERKTFLDFCEENPLIGFKITFNIAKKMSGALRKTNEDVITLFEALVREVEGEDI